MAKVIISGGYGAGWVSWFSLGTEDERKFMATYPIFVGAIEEGLEISVEMIVEFENDWAEAFPDTDLPYMGGLSSSDNLHIVEVAEGESIQITDYDGSESYELLSEPTGYLKF